MLFLVSVVAVISICLVNLYYSPTPLKLKDAFIRCNWRQTDAVLFSMNTKSGVNYEGGHWFHMAENFMVQHSILREVKRLSNSSIAYFNVDKYKFVGELNGVTKFLTIMGLTDGSLKSAHFLHLPNFNEPLKTLSVGSTIIIDKNQMKNHQIFDMTIGPDMKFVTKSTSVSLSPTKSLTKPQQCVKYMGTVGGEWPTPQRGHWFPNNGDIESFRAKIRQLCPMSHDLLSKWKRSKDKKYLLVIYQRDRSRKLLDQEISVKTLQAALGLSWEIRILMHTPDRSPCLLALVLHEVDVLVTPHGFQSMLLLFMPRPSLIFEIFPYRYLKRGYGPFGIEYGVYHSGIMSPPVSASRKILLSVIPTRLCMLSKTCRNFARNDNVRLTSRGVNKLTYDTTKLIEHLRKTINLTSHTIARDFLY